MQTHESLLQRRYSPCSWLHTHILLFKRRQIVAQTLLMTSMSYSPMKDTNLRPDSADNLSSTGTLV